MKYLFALILLAGCTTHSVKDYQCYRVSGPFLTSAGSADEAEQYVRETDSVNDQGSPDFKNKDYQCIEVEKPRPPVDFHALEMGRK